ncbi:helix-turn-helix domain-containing protein [Rubrobacter marinus]|uniref:helix-turn-helix domain-containing protein n=1 Tax=Rubrobacter marinus TaxID=2653852 RepID=UPI001A9F83FE|nr:helix-turn-helix domain-containing protein [Rubrobacter marinus]
MRLREMREERGLTQEALAGLSNVSRPTIHRVEHGQQRPHRSTISKLARALGVEPSEIAPELHAQAVNPNVGVRMTVGIRDEALPYIKKAARRLALNPGDIDELVGAGPEGLYEACRKYDPSRGVPFDRYARWLAICRAKDEARRLYKQHPGFGLEPQGLEPWTY